MSFEPNQLKEAYIKLKSYIYYDNSDLLLRRKLVEFESNKSKDIIHSLLGGLPKPYNDIKNIHKKPIAEVVEAKLEQLTEALNNYEKKPEFIDFFLNEIKVNFYPKSFFKKKSDKNFITNERVEKNGYKVERVTTFIDAPIEIHILSVLWIIENGVHLDKELSTSCFGNRLLLNKDNDKIVQGSGLFRPYYSQYQKWRDESVNIAQNIIKREKNVLFLNLDIRDYFHSIRIPLSELYSGREYKVLGSYYNLKEIFLKIHINYTEQVAQKNAVPYEFYSDIKKDDNNTLKEVVLPIGLLSSYVLANHYLKDFDNNVQQKIKPAYYGRYVDDLLIVLEIPKSGYDDNGTSSEILFSFEKYKAQLNRRKKTDEKISFSEKDLTSLESYILKNFYPLIKLIDTPSKIKLTIENDEKDSTKDRIFKLTGYKSLYCQSDKSLVYYFDHEESDLVIDKLKKELNERTSEFRDFPDEGQKDEAFEDNAYYLHYDDSEGKIRTLKDYKENRYGLTVYLANKIFSALRHDKKVTESEKDQVLKFFRGINCLSFYRLWERIFTFFLVNEHAEAYFSFYIHCLEQIEKLKGNIAPTKVTSKDIAETMLEYLDCAHELSLALNPQFINKTHAIAKNFEFKVKNIDYLKYGFWMNFEPTKPGSFWVIRFRETNMIRHHYVIHPLLNYTEKSKRGTLDLTDLKLDVKNYLLDDELLSNSPRPIRFSECCLAVAYTEMSIFKNEEKSTDGYSVTHILNLTTKKIDVPDNDFTDESRETENSYIYLENAFKIYKKVNFKHSVNNLLSDEELQNKFFTKKQTNLKYDDTNSINILEIEASNGNSKPRLIGPRIAFANTKVEEDNIISSMRRRPNLGIERYQKLSAILQKARSEKADLLLFPECFLPINLLSSLVRYSEKNECLIITGLEHITLDNTAFNFIVTIIPIEVGNIKDSIVMFRLKNHYAHAEELLILGNHLNVPKPIPYRYDIYNWRNLYFSPFYCFELANSMHRSLMKGKIDLLIGVEWNKDTNYFSNIVEAASRDLHVYVAQVNTSHYGDTRLTQPVETERKDILRLKGGINDAILVATIDIPKLREFQRKRFLLSSIKAEFKPLPPDYSLNDVMNRINNRNVI